MACSFSFQTVSILQLVKDQLSIKKYLRYFAEDSRQASGYNIKPTVSPASHSDSHLLFPNWQSMNKKISPASACGFLRLDGTASAHTHRDILKTIMGNTCGDLSSEDIASWLTPIVCHQWSTTCLLFPVAQCYLIFLPSDNFKGYSPHSLCLPVAA